MSNSYPKDPDNGLNKDALEKLYITMPHRHVAALVFNWFVIIITASLSITYFNALVYVIAVIVIGARMHALAILMHDATHFRFLKNKRWNDIITNFMIMYPLLSSIENYRQNHLKHHQHLNTELDPDWMVKIGRKDFTFPKSKSEFLLTLFSYFFIIRGVLDALWLAKRFSGIKAQKPRFNQRLPSLCFAALLVLTLAWFDGWMQYLLYWVVPFFSTFFMFQYVRSVAEHFGGLSYEGVLTSTRTVKANRFEKFFFAPHNIGYHLEHHLHPRVPFYHLPQLHELLMQSKGYAESAHITQGVLSGLLHELSRPDQYKAH